MDRLLAHVHQGSIRTLRLERRPDVQGDPQLGRFTRPRDGPVYRVARAAGRLSFKRRRPTGPSGRRRGPRRRPLQACHPH